MRISLQKILFVLLLGAFLAGSIEARATEKDAVSWIPLEVGNSWEYSLELFFQLTVGTEVQPASVIRGESDVVVVEPVGGFDSSGPVYQRLRTWKLRDTPEGDMVYASSDYLSQSSEGVLDYAYKSMDDDIENTSEYHSYKKPHVIMAPKIRLGRTWNVGNLYVRSRDGEHFENLTAKVIGKESVDTPAGRFEDCLQVSYRGRLHGHTLIEGRKVSKTGTVQRMVWYAPDKGVVKTEVEIKSSWSAPGSGRVRVLYRENYALQKIDLKENVEETVSEKPVIRGHGLEFSN